MDNASSSRRLRNQELRIAEKAIRELVRAYNQQSRELLKTTGLTSAQLVLMSGIAELGEVTSIALSAYADISPATVVTVLDNLEERQLVQRYRSTKDRRIVHTKLTEAGEALVQKAPASLGEAFAEHFARIEAEERRRIIEGVTTLAQLLSRGNAPVSASSRSCTEPPQDSGSKL
ncbi:MarR family transcriptional regulator [Chelativorans sp. Marseille-P2723]|uniref:MarR family winged helix-turn-helix transcriptional regulator n=1 Tax=Chelativorans sp. Marseille-P2723 TaxID=2709133 RepID=UPI001FF05398|nr:MarR family transcriptional regulator [Chelativorans sp. Marseille-P2723]